MGTQWHGMGRDLMQLRVFKQSIMRSDAILRQHDLQLYDMLMNGDERTFNETLNSFVGIAAIQVGSSRALFNIVLRSSFEMKMKIIILYFCAGGLS